MIRERLSLTRRSVGAGPAGRAAGDGRKVYEREGGGGCSAVLRRRRRRRDRQVNLPGSFSPLSSRAAVAAVADGYMRVAAGALFPM